MSKQKTEIAKNTADSSEFSLFISETLQAIMNGLSAAQPNATAVSSISGQSFEFSFHPPSEVAFDIAVTATRSGKESGGLKLQVFSIGANGAIESETKNSTVSRVSFTIPTIPAKRS
jgi:hypothetical protein